MTHPHIVKAFDQELQTLASSIGAMGDFAGAQFVDAMQALLTSDIPLAQRVIEQDRQLDALRRDLLAAAATVIARRQPLANDLGEVLADFRIAEDLERIGDLAKNIAKRATAIAGARFPEKIDGNLRQLGQLASQLLKDAIEAYITRDAEQAMLTRQHDEQIDELHTDIFRTIVAHMKQDHDEVIGLVHLLFCAKNIERIGDHATHIAEAAYETATGRRPVAERRRLDLSSTMGIIDPGI
ncbi:MAG: phosphate transport system regulatory protein PhoU [Burkholderiales bacterium RIFCSPLOWO2_02_FULL_57_36]|nr:MAG: phosphate transport system regulatory protein PhoU [Burkholderiales bacterium RIFCSPLOWO2_02_FULL_57_36]